MTDNDPRPPITFPDRVDPLPHDPAFLEECNDFGIHLDEGDTERLARYLGCLLAANQFLNLTRITDPPEMWRRHAFDSLTILSALDPDLPEPAIADIGSGGGAPGIPLAIALPGARVTLIESTAKKAHFLQWAARHTGLTNTTVLHARAEDAARLPNHRDHYDAVVARALGRLNVAAELTLPFARPAGRAVLIKGQRAEDELREADHAIDALAAEHIGTLPTPTGRLVVLEKSRPTPERFPRRPGEPKRDPLAP